MESVRHHGRETAYRLQEGDDPTLLFVHGSGSTGQSWDEQFERLPYRMAAIDLSGHGTSDDIDAEAGGPALTAYGEDVVSVAEETDADVLAGHSLGGAVVQHVTLDTAFEPAALLLVGTGAKLAVREDIREEWRGTAESAPPRDEWAADHDEAREVYPPVVLRNFLTCHRFDVRDRLDELDVPALAITGENDEMTFPWYHEYLAENLPQCEWTIVDDAGHSSFSDQPDAFAAEVREFIERTL